jgi:preprotein translocase subunit SecD
MRGWKWATIIPGWPPTWPWNFGPEGAKQFAAVTEANVNRNLAIVLDGWSMSAPVIRTAIPMATPLSKGSLPRKTRNSLNRFFRPARFRRRLKLLKSGPWAPPWGKIHSRGLNGRPWGRTAPHFLFMGIYYKWSGMLANLALVLNLFLLLGLMAAFHATLTMPGIAGIILTIGMAVDANVLILERMREEIRLGKSPRMVVDQGYEKAFSAIIDGNLTTIIAAVFLFQFGTGPVKGFGISLMLGLLVSMFTAIVVTHTIYDLWLMNRNVQKLSV